MISYQHQNDRKDPHKLTACRQQWILLFLELRCKPRFSLFSVVPPPPREENGYFSSV